MEIEIDKLDAERLKINRQYRELLQLNQLTSAESLWNLTGESVKNVLKERGTERCLLRDPQGNEQEFFIKRYLPIPLREKLKNSLTLKPFNFTAQEEWEAIIAFHHYELPTMVPVAVAQLPDGRSCNLTLGIKNYKRASEWLPQLADVERKERFITRCAEYIGKMHSYGLAHQDCYLVHLFIVEDEDDQIYLIDLQRVLRRDKLQRRWLIKDLAQLLFSGKEYLNREQLEHFWTTYCDIVRKKHPDIERLKAGIIRKAERIRRHDEKRAARRRLAAAGGNRQCAENSLRVGTEQ